MFTYYRMEPGMINGRNHYTSDDGRFAISYCGDSYWIQRADTRYRDDRFKDWVTSDCENFLPCSCLPVLPGPTWVRLSKTNKPF